MAAVEVTDLGIGALKARLAELATMRVLLGVQGRKDSEAHPNSKDGSPTHGELAYWLHFGTKTMRKRPYIDQAINELNASGKVRAAAKKAVSDLVDGRSTSAVAALVPLGDIGVDGVRDAIDHANAWVDWELSAATVRRKDHNRHLVETGSIRDAQSFTIRDRRTGAVLHAGQGAE